MERHKTYSSMNFHENKPFIIAEIGSNWRRTTNDKENLQIALKSIESAKECGVTAVKFQYFTHKELYGFDGDDTYHLPIEWIPTLKSKSDSLSLVFMCTAFSPKGYEEINEFVDIHKIASSEMKHVEILDTVSALQKPLIISTGSAQYSEIDWLTQYLNKKHGAARCLMECVAAYPAQPSDYRLAVLDEWINHGYTVGISDHTLTNSIAISSIGLGATCFEKHFDAYKNHGLPDSPDGCVSIGPKEMREYTRDIKDVFDALKSDKKYPKRSEDAMQLMHRRRIVATQDVPRGTQLVRHKNFGIFRSKEEDLRGAPPEKVGYFDNKRATRDLKQGEPLWIPDVE